MQEAAYLSLMDDEWQQRIATGMNMLRHCTLCPRQCGVDRISGQLGFCRAAAAAEVAYWQVHYGEEPPLSAAGGAGAIFFSHCNLHCVFCQNHQISQPEQSGAAVSPARLGRIMLELQRQGAQNIDMVSPQHYVPQIIAAVAWARSRGLRLPLVYNTNGYEAQAALDLLDGIVDIYLPDIKYGSDETAARYSGVGDYRRYAGSAIAAMLGQTGPLFIDAQGQARRGVIVRHLVLPCQSLSETDAVAELLGEIGPQHIGMSIMSQYAPRYRAAEMPELARPLSRQEYQAVVERLAELDSAACWVQELESNSCFFPDFTREKVFEE